MHIILFDTVAMDAKSKKRMIGFSVVRFDEDIGNAVVGILQISLKGTKIGAINLHVVCSNPAHLGTIITTVYPVL